MPLTPRTFMRVRSTSRWEALRARLALVGLEVALSRSAHRAEPVVRDVVEGGPGRDPAVGVALVGVVDEPTGTADPLLLDHGFAHGAGRVARCAWIGRRLERSSTKAM